MKYITVTYYCDLYSTDYIDVPIQIIEDDGGRTVGVQVIGSDYGLFYVYREDIKIKEAK